MKIPGPTSVRVQARNMNCPPGLVCLHANGDLVFQVTLGLVMVFFMECWLFYDFLLFEPMSSISQADLHLAMSLE